MPHELPRRAKPKPIKLTHYWEINLPAKPLTLYSTGENQCGRKPVNLLQWFGLLFGGKQINKLLVLCCSHLTFARYFCSFDVAQFNVLFCFDYEDKIWCQYKSKQLCYEKISVVSFYSIAKYESYLCLIFLSFRIDSIRYIACFRSDDEIWWQQKSK